jgi:tetratricopeptide (TPR) repeat protein
MIPFENKIYQGVHCLISSGHKETALWVLDKLLNDYPSYALAHHDRAILAHQSGDIETSHSHFKRAAELAPNNALIQKSLGDYYHVVQGQIDLAVDQYQKVLALKPKEVETLLTIGHLSMARQNFEEARTYYERVLAIDANNKDARHFLEMLIKHRKTQTCQKSWQELCQTDGSKVENDDHTGTIRTLEQVLNVDPEHTPVHKNFGGLCFKQNDKKELNIPRKRTLSAVNNDSRILESYCLQAQQSLKAGLYDNAEKFSQRALQLDPCHPNPYIVKATIQGIQANYAKGVNILKECFDRGTCTTDLMALMADLLFFDNRWKESISWYLALFNSPGVHMESYILLPVALAITRRAQEAEYYLNFILTQNNSDQRLWSIAGWVYALLDNHPQARLFLQKVLNVKTYKVEILLECAMAFEALGDKSNARAANLVALENLKKSMVQYGYLTFRTLNVLVLQHKRLARVMNKSKLQKWRQKQRTVFFVNDLMLTSRQVKIASGLKHMGWHVVVLSPRQTPKELYEFFDETICYQDLPELLHYSQQFKGNLFHVFSQWGGDAATLFALHKPGKVIFSPVDIHQISFEKMISFQDEYRNQHVVIPQQRFCLQEADGICTKDLMLLPSRRELGYKLSSNILLFQDYCWNRALNKKYGDGDEIHAVYAGSLPGPNDPDSEYVRPIKDLTAKGIHVHIYPHSIWLLKENYNRLHMEYHKYFELAERNPMFTFHDPLQPNELHKELIKYDFGLSIHTGLTYGLTRPKIRMDVYKYCGSSKLFDYLDAGLPMILNREAQFQFRPFDRFGLVMDAHDVLCDNGRENLQQLLKAPDLTERIQKARNHYSVSKQAPRLVAFYEKILQS